MTGAEKGCDGGHCGGCTVLVDGRRINSCLTLTVMHQGAKITTTDSLIQGEDLAPIQTAFIDAVLSRAGAARLGRFARPSRASTRSRRVPPAPSARENVVALTDPEIRERMSGNLCRCGAHDNMVAAIRATAKA